MGGYNREGQGAGKEFKCVHYVLAGSESAIPHNKDGHQEWTPFAS